MFKHTIQLAQYLKNPAINPNIGTVTTWEGGISIFTSFIRMIINTAFIIGSLLLLFALLRGGIEYIQSGGDKEAKSKAQGRITTALIGLTILFSSYAIMSLVSGIFGINLLQINIPRFGQ